MKEQDFKKIFTAHKSDMPDNGFSERVIGQLPERKSILPQMVMLIFVVVGLALTIAIQGITPMLDQISSLMTSISHMQVPSPGSVATYLGIIALMGIIGYSVAQADAG